MAKCQMCKKAKGLKKLDGYCKACIDTMLRNDDYDSYIDESELKIIFGKARKDRHLNLASEKV